MSQTFKKFVNKSRKRVLGFRETTNLKDLKMVYAGLLSGILQKVQEVVAEFIQFKSLWSELQNCHKIKTRKIFDKKLFSLID
jgi:hypothetical protein